jgi:aryl-phospho-beta-D-glucosidase BglC (GH1 family)
MKTGLFLQAVLFSVLYLSCSCKGPEPQPVGKTLTVAPDSLLFSANGGIDTIHLSTDASEWRIEASENWVSISVGFGVAREKDIIVTVAANDVSHLRSAKLTISAPDADTVYVFIKQDAVPASLYPDYSQPIAPDASGMSRTATQIAREMYMGWNLGNTLEVPGNETGWGNPKATQLLIDSVKAAGFNTIRLPCAWDSYLENRSTAKIRASWLARVKEVIDYCYKNNMYVILNIHWDGGWLENNVTTAKQAENNAKQKAIWQQIAMQFRDYDDHLLFAGTNEPNVENETQMTVLYSYLETFIDAVRQTGGRNAYRTLVVQGPSTDIAKTNQLMTRMPNDDVPNRLMAEVHYYTPWNFCGMDKDETWGKMFYYWGSANHSATDATRNATWGEEAELKRLFG